MKSIDLGEQRPDYGGPEIAQPSKPKKMKTVYPNVTVSKLIKPGLKFGDTFEATVTVRVLEVASGKPYSDAPKVQDRTSLELLSMTPMEGKKSSKTGREGHAQSVIEDAMHEQMESKDE